MRLTFPDLRFALVALLLAAGLALTLAPSSADAASPCSRHGDKKPEQLGKKKARNAVICLINKQRNGQGRGDLDRDYRLIEAARKHSGAMARKGCFSHECPGEKSLLGRLKAVNYITGGLTRWAYGENIAYGTDRAGTPREIVSDWMHSSGHRSNILSRTFEDVGVGFHNKGDRGYYTADFGLRRG
jgi:uncharacterized protein YkwD